MDFVDWCSVVLNRLIALLSASSEAREAGVNISALAASLFDQSVVALSQSSEYKSVEVALRELERNHFIEVESSSWCKVPLDKRNITRQVSTFWESVCQQELDN